MFAHCAAVNEDQRNRSQREYELAVSLYRDERNAQSAIVALERALRSDPANAEAHLLMGQLYGESGMYDRAEPFLRRAVELFRAQAADDPERASQYGEARNSLGAALVNLGRAAEALPMLREVSSDVHYRAPHLALGNLGAAYLALHRDREAVQVLERALGIRRDFCVGAYRLGEARHRIGDDEHAIEALDQALGTTAHGCDHIQAAWRLRGELRASLHQVEAARADLTRCRDLDPGSTDGRECATQLRATEAP